MLFQGTVILFYRKDKIWEYLGNMMTISFAGALLLSPMLVVAYYFQMSTVLFMLYFLVVAGLMLLEHLRRSKILNLGYTMSISWVLYRLIVLALILLF